MTIKDQLHNITPDVSNSFLLPFQLDYGSYSLIDIVGGSGTPGFRSSYSIFSIKGSLDAEKINAQPLHFEKSFSLTREERLVPLEVHIPALENRTSKDSIVIEGRTASKALLSINGQEIISKKGKFSEEIHLREGDNELAFNVSLADKTHDERIIVTKISDRPLFVWEYPVEDLISTKKFQLIKGWAGLDCEIVIDGNVVPITPLEGNQGIGQFVYDYPIRIGINEIEIVVQNKSGTVRESRFIECDYGKLSFDTVKRLPKKIKSYDDHYIVKGQVTTGSSISVNEKMITPSLNGEIETIISLDTIGSNQVTIKIDKDQIYSNE